MNKKIGKQYTTIQILKDINDHVRIYCKERGLIASKVTEHYWLGLISASMSGSILT